MASADVIFAIACAFLLALLTWGTVIAVSAKPDFAGHPKGLYVLFFAEMWERFSYYGMRALLILYLVRHWQYSDGKANLVYGAYTSLVYITPVLGGYLADRYLGQRKAVLFGAVLLTIGQFMMAIHGDGGHNDPTINVFWLALSFIIVGSGFLKANISVIVGQLYARTDIRRDGAYTIFYMGINLGGAIGTIIAGYLGETYSWSLGFGVAGVGMLLGLVVFVLYRPFLQGRGEASNPSKLAQRVFGGVKLEWFLYMLGLASIGGIWLLIQYQGFYGWLLLVMGSLLLLYVLLQAFKLDPQARDRIFAIIFLIVLQPVFWGLFEQGGGSLNLFTDRYIARGGVPPSLFQSINPIYIILLGPVLAWLWTILGRKGLEPSAPAKFGLGLIQLGFGFLILKWGDAFAGADGRIPVLFLFMIYLFSTTGELCLAPVGISAMNRLAPRHMASVIMGAWFFATAGGNFVAGKIGQMTGGEGGTMSKEGTLEIYWNIGLMAMGVGIAVLLVGFLVTRLMHLDTLSDDDALPGIS